MVRSLYSHRLHRLETTSEATPDDAKMHRKKFKTVTVTTVTVTKFYAKARKEPHDGGSNIIRKQLSSFRCHQLACRHVLWLWLESFQPHQDLPPPRQTRYIGHQDEEYHQQ